LGGLNWFELRVKEVDIQGSSSDKEDKKTRGVGLRYFNWFEIRVKEVQDPGLSPEKEKYLTKMLTYCNFSFKK
jgi:hypothetical protein